MILAFVSTHSSRSGSWNLSAVTPACFGLVAQLARFCHVQAARVIVAANAARIHRAAEQLVHRHAHDLAADVPQRLVDAGNGRAQHRAAAIEAADVHQLLQVLHLHRIAADDEVLQVIHARHGGGGLAFERRFAPSHHALVGFDFHEHIGAVRTARCFRPA